MFHSGAGFLIDADGDGEHRERRGKRRSENQNSEEQREDRNRPRPFAPRFPDLENAPRGKKRAKDGRNDEKHGPKEVPLWRTNRRFTKAYLGQDPLKQVVFLLLGRQDEPKLRAFSTDLLSFSFRHETHTDIPEFLGEKVQIFEEKRDPSRPEQQRSDRQKSQPRGSTNSANDLGLVEVALESRRKDVPAGLISGLFERFQQESSSPLVVVQPRILNDLKASRRQLGNFGFSLDERRRLRRKT